MQQGQHIQAQAGLRFVGYTPDGQPLYAGTTAATSGSGPGIPSTGSLHPQHATAPSISSIPVASVNGQMGPARPLLAGQQPHGGVHHHHTTILVAAAPSTNPARSVPGLGRIGIEEGQTKPGDGESGDPRYAERVQRATMERIRNEFLESNTFSLLILLVQAAGIAIVVYSFFHKVIPDYSGPYTSFVFTQVVGACGMIEILWILAFAALCCQRSAINSHFDAGGRRELIDQSTAVGQQPRVAQGEVLPCECSCSCCNCGNCCHGCCFGPIACATQGVNAINAFSSIGMLVFGICLSMQPVYWCVTDPFTGFRNCSSDGTRLLIIPFVIWILLALQLIFMHLAQIQTYAPCSRGFSFTVLGPQPTCCGCCHAPIEPAIVGATGKRAWVYFTQRSYTCYTMGTAYIVDDYFRLYREAIFTICVTSGASCRNAQIKVWNPDTGEITQVETSHRRWTTRG